MVEVDHKQLYPALSEYDGIVLCEYRTFKVIKERCYQWYEELK